MRRESTVSRLKTKKRGGSNLYPEKRTINLLYRNKSNQAIVAEFMVFFIFMFFTMIFSQYFVIGALQRADHAEHVYQDTQRKLATLKSGNGNYAEVRALYSHYGNGYLNESELAKQDRITMLNVIDERVHVAGGIQNIQITDNLVTINVEVQNANRLPEIIESLEESEYVSYVTASVASTQKDQAGAVSATPDGSVIGDRLVNATISVYFRTPKEVKEAVENGSATTKDQALDAGHDGTATGKNAYVPEISMPEIVETTAAPETKPAQQEGIPKASPKNTGKTTTTRSASSAANKAARQEQARQQIAQQQAQAAQQQQIAQQQAQAAQQAQQQMQQQFQQKPANVDTPVGNNGIYSLQGGAAPF